MNSQPPIIPLPASYRYTDISLGLRSPIPVVVRSHAKAARSIVDVCGKLLLATSGMALHVVEPPLEEYCPAIQLEHVPDGSKAKGAYRLAITRDGVRISASSDTGLFYGMIGLVQLLAAQGGSGGEVELTGIEIEDQPRFEWRGMHLDVSRHFMPVPFIKKYIDLLAYHKMSVFHWHLTDDQGWRIQIEKYPRLTDVGAWRHEAGGGRYGGFYTQAEIREIVQYASERYVTIIPEIELPGHATAALAAYPEYSCTGGPFNVATSWGIFDDVYCVGRETTFEFLGNVLTEVAELFPGKYVHIGGDESPKARWQAHDLCQDRKREFDLRTEDDLQSYFVTRIGRHLKSLGKRLVGWDEILDGGAPAEATIMAWRSAEKGIEAARAGHPVVMCPMSHCYFDHYQSRENEPKAIGGHTPLDKVYAFEPVPAGLPPELIQHILGAQANVWTEYMADESHVLYMVFPRMCALSEVLWSKRDARSWPQFLERLQPHLKYLELLGVNYRRLTT
ncbi:beta-N-acetylglucosaminidase [candidate division GN15 bacterium]|uniref:beta-N-acetylhexosaminidase n=1 Tax=candidate division GN15 bacterium TaxID=2072418 RepID=A0A855X7T9_9BACT|nr:MAG: beta-N-acetylglucosaminidase [candidate division GN15 bacterium]